MPTLSLAAERSPTLSNPRDFLRLGKRASAQLGLLEFGLTLRTPLHKKKTSGLPYEGYKERKRDLCLRTAREGKSARSRRREDG